MDYNESFLNCEITVVDDYAHWHKLRSMGLGGSDIAVVINNSNYKTPYQLYMEKIGEVKPAQVSNEAIDKGNRLEGPMLELFKQLHINKYRVIDTKDISLHNKEFPFMRANLDGALLELETDRKGIYEGKTTTIQNMDMLDAWKQDSMPISYYCQCLHYLLVTGFDFVVLFALLDFPWKGDHGQQETRIIVINREDVLEDLEFIKKAEIDFWNRVVNKMPPVFLNKKIKI